MRISDWSSDVCSSDLFNGAAPAVAPRRAVGTTWTVQTSWPGGVGLDTFKAWCHSIVEQPSGELSFEPYAPNELVGRDEADASARRLRGNAPPARPFPAAPVGGRRTAG